MAFNSRRGELFSVDDTEVQRMVSNFDPYLQQEMMNLRVDAQVIAHEAISDEIERAAMGQPGFYPEYVDHLQAVLEMMIMPVKVTSVGFVFDFNWYEVGTRNELREGFHQGAALQGGGHLTLGTPYTGQALKNSKAIRYFAWRHIYDGTDIVRQKPLKRGGFSKPKIWSVAGLREATIEARISIWGNRAPEWILLDQGNNAHYPVIEPTMFTERANEAILRRLDMLFRVAVERAQARADEIHSMGTITRRQDQSTSELLREKAFLQKRDKGGRFSGGYI